MHTDTFNNAGAHEAAHEKDWLKFAIFAIALPVGLEIASEIAFTFTDWGSDILTSIADTFNLHGGIHGGMVPGNDTAISLSEMSNGHSGCHMHGTEMVCH